MSLTTILLTYLLFINVLTFFLFVSDKAKSVRGQRRTPEKTLLLFALIGGSPSALLAMNRVRHKTKKLSFQAILAVILALQIVAITFFLRSLAPFV